MSKKTLNFASTDENEETSNVEVRDQRCDLLNVDDLLGKQTSQLKVVIVAPSGRVESHSSFDDKTKSVIVNLCRKNWKTAANSLFQQPNVREELEEPLRKAVSTEFKQHFDRFFSHGKDERYRLTFD